MQSEVSTAGAEVPTQALRQNAPQSTGIACRQVRTAAERAEHLRIRHRIFVAEQALFSGSDLDSRDHDDSAIALLGYCDGVAAGTVRLFVLDRTAALWQGDRLAVLAPFRTRGLGAPLVRCAVATAAALGGQTMSAHIQPANVGFFERLGWDPVGETEIYAGVIHQPMSIVLPSRDDGMATVRSLALGSTSEARDALGG